MNITFVQSKFLAKMNYGEKIVGKRKSQLFPKERTGSTFTVLVIPDENLARKSVSLFSLVHAENGFGPDCAKWNFP